MIIPIGSSLSLLQELSVVLEPPSSQRQMTDGKTCSKKLKKDLDTETQSGTEMKKSNSSYKVTMEEFETIQPITPNQELAFQYWDEGYNLVLSGSAGTGKTMMALYFALQEVLKNDRYRKVIIMRSVVPTREVGFLQGSLKEKTEPFEAPYKGICETLFGYEGAYGKLVTSGKLEFQITSHIRGCTFDNAIIIVDEMQNCNFHELDSVITRLGNDCRIIFSGDRAQSDFKFADEKDGIIHFLNLLEHIRFFKIVQFDWGDIVRSDFVRDYIMTKEMLNGDY